MSTLTTPKKKDESFFDKIGTLGRKKKKEVQDVADEGKQSIISPTSPSALNLGPDSFQLGEYEERSMIEKHSRDDPKLEQLIKLLVDWINDELASERILVKDLEQDLFDGQILQKLIEKLARLHVEMPEVTQSEIGQKQKLSAVLGVINTILQISPGLDSHKWSVDSIHSKNLVAILHLLVALAQHFRAPIRLSERLCVDVLVVQKVAGGKLKTRSVQEEIVKNNQVIEGVSFERDAFDTLFDHAPDKLSTVKSSLLAFVNHHLAKVNLEVTDIHCQFHDGVYFILLIGILEGYYVPLHSFHLTPASFEEKLNNVNLAYQLIIDSGLRSPNARPEDVVNLDLKSTLRIIYDLFLRYKSLE